MQPSKFLIDGIDRLGKSTLVKNLLDELGYHLTIHYSKPQSLKVYANEQDGDPLALYQANCNINMFNLLRAKDLKVIIDRTHLGETIYAPLYRGYSGDYVFGLEKQSHMDKRTDLRLILLTTSNFNIHQDDGESFDWSNRAREQQMFLNAFCKSNIRDKVIIDVHDGNGGFKDPKMILMEALSIKQEIVVQN